MMSLARVDRSYKIVLGLFMVQCWVEDSIEWLKDASFLLRDMANYIRT